MAVTPILFAFGGLPGVGKSTLAKALARSQSAVYLRIDTIEQSLRAAGFKDLYDEGYQVAFATARENLQLGASVVADSTNPVVESRQHWQKVAEQSGSKMIEIHVVCSDPKEHQTRVETRVTDVTGLVLPTWKSVASREFDEWPSVDITLDTAGQTPDQSIAAMLTTLARLEVGI